MADIPPIPTRNQAFDLVVVGSGAAGLSAAVTAAYHGLSVVVVEKAEGLGGATAWSGGWMWAPLNPLARAAGIEEDPETVRTYLRHELGERFDPVKIDAFLAATPSMVAFFHDKTSLQFADGNAIADIHADTPGAGTGGRSVIAAPFDGRKLNRRTLNKLRKTMPETAFLGMPIQAGPDLMAFLTVTRSFKSFVHVAKRFTRHLFDLALYGRTMQLVNGVALTGRLAKSADDLGVDTWVSSPATRLVRDGQRVIGVVVDTPEGEVTLNARRGVVLAAGGFPWDVARRRELFPRTPSGEEHWPLPPPSASGDGLRLGEAAGGVVDDSLYSPVAWAPVSVVPYQDGHVGHFPHIIDRGKPGLIGVLRNGQRFVNEAGGYYDYVDAMIKAVPEGEEVCSWLICNQRFQRRYGIGITRPAPLPFKHWVHKGYLKRGRTLTELAQACGIDPAGLERTIATYNEHARLGEDPEFGRGSTPYNRKNGDPTHQPNPCVAPLDPGPFYAVKVVPGCFGTFAGLKTNEHAQVLDGQNRPIDGLYAAGTDMASIMGGFYPAGGINLGPAMTFGHIAGLHAAGKRQETASTPNDSGSPAPGETA
ncbi:FAD-dependent oxidoreductase [Halomonas urumqiensis]|uniref:FAD-binding dehydrogenase n=1 Tax=Halomonas urumqiensis TaxID=1684789 RepID=A0A2N7UJ52_9GAMM|nr:FAD-dependent oxidoreductase [Halomonas urumqiensis]PMR80464.1 FAD-binding dehydrogenase [Halomonas urumqiensis]PTB01691.1 FAD-binding protein [Halomonas urumqiensis]GHE22216.1 FAD-binding dehydrogenase [Halomonas urumqiensis]